MGVRGRLRPPGVLNGPNHACDLLSLVLKKSTGIASPDGWADTLVFSVPGGLAPIVETIGTVLRSPRRGGGGDR